MNNFLQWIDLKEEDISINWLNNFPEEVENIEEMSRPSFRWEYSDVPHNAAVVVDALLKYASKPTFQDGRPNWMHNNYIYWAKNRKLLEKLIIEKFNTPGPRKARPTPEDSTLAGLRTTLKYIGASIMQGSHGGGGNRRDHNYAVSQKIKEPSIALDAGFPDAKPLPGKNIYKNPNAWADVSQKIRQASQILNNPNFSLSKEDIRMWKMYRDYLMHFKNEFKTKGSAPDFNSWSQHMSKLHA